MKDRRKERKQTINRKMATRKWDSGFPFVLYTMCILSKWQSAKNKRKPAGEAKTCSLVRNFFHFIFVRNSDHYIAGTNDGWFSRLSTGGMSVFLWSSILRQREGQKPPAKQEKEIPLHIDASEDQESMEGAETVPQLAKAVPSDIRSLEGSSSSSLSREKSNAKACSLSLSSLISSCTIRWNTRANRSYPYS